MKRIISILLIIIGCNIVYAEDKITIEAANCFGSKHLPFSSGWNYTVGDKGLLFKEFAVKGSYKIYRFAKISLASGWVINREEEKYRIVLPIVGWEPAVSNVRKMFYILPTVGLWTKAVRLDLGTLLYDIHNDNGHNDNYYYSLDGSHHVMPSASLEIGYPSFIYGRFLNSFPLGAGSLLEFGLGGYVWGQNEQRLYFIAAPAGIGYRGQFKIYRDFALSFGILGADFTRDGIAAMNFGIKTSF
jgi:hypothetical protein